MAHWLRDRGFEAYAVRGGVSALDGSRAGELPIVDSQPAVRPGPGPFAALRHPHYRRFTLAVTLSLTGNWVEAAAFGYVVLLLGGSAATLGLIGFLNTIPNLVLGLPAGALADRYDRRRLLLGFQAANLGVAALLAALWQTGSLTVGAMGAIAVVGGSLGTLSFPAFQGLLASTVHDGMRGRRLEAIPGAPPDLGEMPTGCSFAPRCRFVRPDCTTAPPDLRPTGDSHLVRCVLAA